MNTPKQNYIERIRTQSAYPTFRSFIGVIALLFYVLGGVFILGGVIGGFIAMSTLGIEGLAGVFIGLIGGLIYIVLGKVTKEAALMLADMADSITDLNSRYEQ